MSLFSTLLRLGIISSLSDREAFINKTSQFIERYYDDPEAAERVAKAIAAYLEDLKNNMSMRRAVRSSLRHSEFATKEDLEEIQKMLEDLMAELRQQQKEKHSDDGIS